MGPYHARPDPLGAAGAATAAQRRLLLADRPHPACARQTRACSRFGRLAKNLISPSAARDRALVSPVLRARAALSGAILRHAQFGSNWVEMVCRLVKELDPGLPRDGAWRAGARRRTASRWCGPAAAARRLRNGQPAPSLSMQPTTWESRAKGPIAGSCEARYGSISCWQPGPICPSAALHSRR